MDSHLTRRAILLAAAASAHRSSWADAGLRLIGAEIPPLAGPAFGFYAERLAQLARQVGFEQQPSWMPWARAYVDARAQGRALLFPVPRVASIERDWQWLAPLGKEESVLVVRRDALRSPADLDNPDVASRLRVGALRGCPSIPSMTDKGFTSFEYAVDSRAQARKLALGRIDAWITTRRTADYWLAREGVDFALLWPFVPKGDLAFYVAASRDVDPAQLAAWRTTVRST